MALPLAAGFLGTFFVSFTGHIVARALWSVGVGVISYVGISQLMDTLVGLVHTKVGGISSNVLHIVGLAGFDVFLSLVLSANCGTVAFLMATSGLKRFGFLNNQSGGS